MNYARDEFVETARRVFNPGAACAAAVKRAINQCAKVFNVSPHRARDLMRGKAVPKVEEMDKLRELDGRWCTKAKRAVEPLLERMHDKIDALYSAYVERRERKRAQKPIVERMYDRA